MKRTRFAKRLENNECKFVPPDKVATTSTKELRKLVGDASNELAELRQTAMSASATIASATLIPNALAVVALGVANNAQVARDPSSSRIALNAFVILVVIGLIATVREIHRARGSAGLASMLEDWRRAYESELTRRDTQRAVRAMRSSAGPPRPCATTVGVILASALRELLRRPH